MDFAGFVRSQLENEIATGGATVIALGALLAMLRDLPRVVWGWAKRRAVTSVDVTDHDQAFHWLVSWLGKHEYSRRARILTASTRQMKQPAPVGSGGDLLRKPMEIVFSPAPGRHLLWFRGSLVLLDRERREIEHSGDFAYHETIRITARKRSTVLSLIEEARQASFPVGDRAVAILRSDGYAWEVVARRAPRPIESVILEGSLADDIVTDVRRFLESEKWYADHGVPYQRGYLLEGPPGSGKTSLSLAMASMFGRDLYLMRPTSITDDQFSRVMSQLPDGAILLIEDVDCMFDGRTRNKDDTAMTFSGFLNGIDGVSAPSGRILILTTNHPEKLDQALVRPGRVDRRIRVGNATPDQARRLYLRFFPGHEAESERFAIEVKRSPVAFSMAQLQEHLMANLSEPPAAADLGGAVAISLPN